VPMIVEIEHNTQRRRVVYQSPNDHTIY
jgi:hypothetical protein